MTGRVFQRRPGKGQPWSYVVDVGVDPATGRRRQKRQSSFPTRKAATAALADVVAQVRGAGYVDPSRLTLGDWLRQWSDGVRGSVRPSTAASYDMVATKRIAPRLGSAPLRSLTSALVEGLYADLLDAGLSARTVRYSGMVLRRALEDAVNAGLLGRNPADRARRPKVKDAPPMATWKADELRAFLAHVSGDRLYPLWLLLATTGMRRGEALGLAWREVDLDGRRLAVSRTLTTVNNRPTFSTPKTARGRRSIALDSATVAALGTIGDTNSRSAWRGVRATKTAALCSAGRTGRCSIPTSCPGRSPVTSRRPSSPPSVSTTFATPTPRSRWPPAVTRRWSRTGSGTPGWHSHSTCTRTPSPKWTRRRPKSSRRSSSTIPTVTIP